MLWRGEEEVGGGGSETGSEGIAVVAGAEEDGEEREDPIGAGVG